MYSEETIDELLEGAKRVTDFIFVKDFNRFQLIDLANGLKTKNTELKEIYWLDGSDSLNYPSFASIKLNPRIVIKGKEMRSKTDGLIFPQSEPIILVIENFDRLKKEDQEKYIERICRREDHDYYPHYYLHHKSVVIIGYKSSFEKPVMSYKFNVRVLH